MWICRKLKYEGKQFDKYIIEKNIGEGRYGVCFLARSDIGKKVIIKKFKLGIFKKHSENIKYEAVILSKLNDKRIPKFLGVINQKGFYGFILELKLGCTVEEFLFKHKYKFTRKEVFNIGLQLIEIIKYIHKNKVVHGDIRIPNVLIDKGQVYLIDFGLARWADDYNCPYDLDFSCLGDFLLYLLYSSFEKKTKYKNLPWYKELDLSEGQKLFLKRLMRIEIAYKSIEDVKTDFIKEFEIKD